jgi:hypothetical protein
MKEKDIDRSAAHGLPEGWTEVYLAYITPSKDPGFLTGHVIRAAAEVIHERHPRLFGRFRYNGMETGAAGGMDEFYLEAGPLGETCVVTEDKEEAVSRLVWDIMTFNESVRKMEWYGVIGSTSFEYEARPQIEYTDIDGTTEPIDPETYADYFDENEAAILGLIETHDPDTGYVGEIFE